MRHYGILKLNTRLCAFNSRVRRFHYRIQICDLKFRSRRLFVITKMLENAIAAAAMIGLSKIPKNGYNKPAAIGIPAMLYANAQK